MDTKALHAARQKVLEGFAISYGESIPAHHPINHVEIYHSHRKLTRGEGIAGVNAMKLVLNSQAGIAVGWTSML